MARRTKEDALVTRERILDAAELLFQSQGVSRTSLQHIAERAGATRGAIYWHFKDKADLFNAMLERVTLPLEVQCASAATTRDPLASLQAAMLTALSQVVSDPQLARVFEIASYKVEYAGDTLALQQRHLEERNARVRDFEATLSEAARQAGVELPVPAHIAAQGLHALVNGLFQNWLLDRQAFDLVQTGRHSLHTYFAGLGLACKPACTDAAPPTGA